MRWHAVGYLAVLFLFALGSPTVSAQFWASYGRNPQHNALAELPSQVPQKIRWSAPVDLDPQYSRNGDLYIHYGSPVITARNTVIVPVKTGAQDGFSVFAYTGATGAQIWTYATDYSLPQHDWTPPMGITLTPRDASVVIPGAGGTVWILSSPNLPQVSPAPTRIAFFNTSTTNYYNQGPVAFNHAIKICTPITCDHSGNLYFGYFSTGEPVPGYPSGIPSGLARVSIATGTGSFVAAPTLCGDTNITKIAYNCAPALTPDGKTLYIGVNQSGWSYGYLCQVKAATLQPISSILLRDPRNASWEASVVDNGTSSPTIGPDGDVYYGVLEAQFPSNHARGWLLHFDSNLTTTKIPGAFGWDDSASIVPARLVPSYTGTSPYLVLTKYNNYSDPGIGGDGENKVAVLDPNAGMVDPISGATVMREVLTVLGPTKNHGQRGVREWCINSAAIDEVHKCAVINSEDGHVYRWSFLTNTLSPGLPLSPPTGEAYTSTVIGPDGAVYAINNATLFSCVAHRSGIGHSISSEFSLGNPARFFRPELLGALLTAVLLTLVLRRLARARRAWPGRGAAVPLSVLSREPWS
jgi:hypothetical protein